ncbi:MAG: GNAT family N-acetyltransferase [Jatrophihabitantaceae bacterium]
MLAADLLAAYDNQVRTQLGGRLPPGWSMSWDGPVLRVSGGYRGFVCYRDLAGLAGPALDALLDRTCAHYDARGEGFEWKWHSHDQPPELAERLLAHGFVPEEPETVLVGLAAELTDSPALPAGVRVREVTKEADLRRIGDLEGEIWDADWSWLAEDLIARRKLDPELLAVYAAEAGGRFVSAAWLSLNPGTEFAGLWGGSTLAAWRGRGIYRTLVARRAQRAVRCGYRYLQVDASSDSQPILHRLGFVAITGTRPYIHQPPD